MRNHLKKQVTNRLLKVVGKSNLRDLREYLKEGAYYINKETFKYQEEINVKKFITSNTYHQRNENLKREINQPQEKINRHWFKQRQRDELKKLKSQYKKSLIN